jgi:hypothetical protein
MPITLPSSGVTLTLDGRAPVEHGRDWFECPAEGHFWLWVPSSEARPPYELGKQIVLVLDHAPAPRSRAEMARFIRVVELMPNGLYGWDGETLDTFPRYRTISATDRAAWDAWIADSERQNYLDRQIRRCWRLAERAKHTTGVT